MSHSRKPKRREGKNVVQVWDYLKVPNKTTAAGWKAGPYFGCETHRDGNTKPCRHEMTDGKLSCAFCAMGKLSVFKAYLPFWDTDYCRRFVLTNEDFVMAWDEIPNHAPIKIVRAAGSREPCVPRLDESRLKSLPAELALTTEVDLFPSLLVIWGDTELCAWAANQKQEAPPPPPKRDILREAGKIEMEKGAKLLKNRLPVKKEETEKPFAELFPELKDKFNGNGKH